MFIINKYIWGKRGVDVVPYPEDVHEFCKCYRGLREMEKPATYAGVHCIHFEDLIYNYDKTVEGICGILGVDATAHKKKFTHLDPRRSIENTQLFLAKEEFAAEAEVIARELPEYLYPFPYERKPDCEKTF